MSTAMHEPSFPWVANLGGQSVRFRLMTAADKEELMEFVRSLPEEEMYFLLMDVSTPQGMEHWVQSIQEGRNVTVIAEQDNRILGYGSLHHSESRWTRHLGEMRMLVAPGQRGRGIGKLLGHEVFAIAHDLGLRRLLARMASSQLQARRLFQRLGFHIEALLADMVIDSADRTQDLVLMSYDVSGFHD